MSLYLPALSPLPDGREMTAAFAGLDRRPVIASGAFAHMQNLTSDAYPLLSVRPRRAKLRTLTKPNGLWAHEKLCWVDGTALYYGGEQVGTVADSPKTFVNMGAYLLIWPDKVCYNTHTGEFTHLEATVTTTGTVTAAMCSRLGEPYTGLTVSSSPPENPANGAKWLDTSADPNVLRTYSELTGVWAAVPTTYVKIEAEGIGAGFQELDAVEISGMAEDALNGSFVLYGAGEDYVIVTGLLSAQHTQSAAVTICRTVPDMDFLTENENRVWGCSSANHEIYACALGDPTNWNRFLGTAADSYAATVGSGGAFTGAATHLGYVLFFKENTLHKLYGSQPSKFQLTNTSCRGVQSGGAKSLATVNETLFYKSPAGVCSYNSALPQSASAALGEGLGACLSAGQLGGKYYICLKDAKGEPSLFVYDTARGLWHREDGAQATWMAACEGDLYFIDGRDNGLYSVTGCTGRYASGTPAVEGPLEWCAETGDIGLTSPDAKYVSKLQLRVEIGDDSLFGIEVKYSDEREFHEVKRLHMSKTATFAVPILPRRCDTLRLRLFGRGDFRLYSVTKTVVQGE